MHKESWRIAIASFTARSAVGRRRQRGAVLIVCLLILLVMTVTGVTGMMVTTLEEKMSGNMRDRNLAFQAAETALRAGENLLNTNTPTFDCTLGMYPERDSNCDNTLEAAQIWQSIDWSVAGNRRCIAGLADLSSPPCYIIERLSYSTTIASSGTGGSLETGTASESGATQSWYRITARATGGSTNAVVILQSIYRR